MELSEPLVRQSPVTLAAIIRALRAFSLPVSVGPVFVAVAAAVPVGRWHWGVLLASAIGAGLLHVGGNLLNDYFDYLYNVDHRTEGDELRPSRVLVRRLLLPRDVMIEAAVCMSLALGLGLYLIWQCGIEILWFGLAGAVSAYVYTGPPLKLKYHALGEIVIFIVFGPLLLVGAAWAQTLSLAAAFPALLASIPVGMATTAVLVGNNVRDRDEDSGGNIVTIGRFAGGKFARGLYLFLVFGSPLGLALIGAIEGPRLLLITPLALPLIFKPAAAVWKDRRLPDIDAQTARYETILLALALAAYVARW
jgi:1,4-dihydroxy-2-naphthoate polyprenyltransferase